VKLHLVRGANTITGNEMDGNAKKKKVQDRTIKAVLMFASDELMLANECSSANCATERWPTKA
jgi:hypothetical protein